MSSGLRRLFMFLTIVLLGATTSAASASGAAAEGPPQLGSWSADPGPYRAGDAIEFTYTVTNPEQLHRITVGYRETTTGQRHAFEAYWDLPQAAATGTVAYTVPTVPVEGPNDVTYTVAEVGLQDLDGRWSTYYADGSLGSTVLAGGSHDVDLTSQLSFVDTQRDHTAPVLHSLSVAPSDITTGGTVTVGYSASDVNLHSVTVYGQDQAGSWVTLAMFGDVGLPWTGSAQWSPDAPDRVTVVRVDLQDVYGNLSRYHPSGRYTWGMWHNPEQLEGTHQVSMPVAPITVRPAQVSGLSAQAGSGTARLQWTQQQDLGHRIVVNPGGRVLTGESGTTNRDLLISGLTNGVAHTFSVTTTGNSIESSATSVAATPRMASARVFGTGDRNRDGRADLWAAPRLNDPTSTATWRLYHGAGSGTFARTGASTIPATRAPLPGSSTGRGPGAPLGALYLAGSDLIEPTATGSRVIGRGFDTFRTIDASSDLTSDGIADLIGITPGGDFYLYTSTSTGAIGRGVRLGGGWNAFGPVFSPGDFTGDARADLLAVDGLGKLWLYPGNGRGGFGARTQIGSGWGTFGAVLPMRDFSGDGKVDVGAITTAGALIMYTGNGRGGFIASRQIGTGWGAFL